MDSIESVRGALKTKTLLVGLVTKNVCPHLPYVLENVDRYCSVFDTYYCMVVDGYSTDGTYEIAKEWETKDLFRRKVLRQPSKGLPRPLSLCEARNTYMSLLESRFGTNTYLLLLDADEVNSRPIELDGFLSCWLYSGWSMMGANQSKVYYDIWALRNAECPEDCWEMVRKTGDRYRYIDGVQVPKATDHPIIECESCFGGAAVYDTTYLRDCRYYSFYTVGSSNRIPGVQSFSPQMADGTLMALFGGKEVCEHVPFHQQVRERQGKLYINPRWIIADGR